MEDHEDEELQMALRMSMQQEPLPEPKRSKPWDNAGASSEELPVEDSPEAKNRKLQRELMAAAAEKRMTRLMSKSAKNDSPPTAATSFTVSGPVSGIGTVSVAVVAKKEELGEEMSVDEANQLFSMVFGDSVSKDILAQWTNQGIRFSPEPETSMGLVQLEGGPCGVLAAIQAFVLKYLIFFPDEVVQVASYMPQDFNTRTLSKSESAASNIFTSLSEDRKARALVRSMSEILFLCGSNQRAMIATLSLPGQGVGECEDSQKDEIVAKTLEGLSIESASDLHKTIRVHACTSQTSAFQRLEAMIPFFQSRMGAMLFLISALLSRGLESVQADRDDPSLPLVTAPFGHASQEIVNLLLCGQAAPNVFDGRMDLGGGMFLMGISSRVEVGFLTLLESLNFCKVGQNLKCPKWPIWVVGSESHYTVLFALDTYVQDENELEERESHVRKAFDAQDQSGGGGFISVEGFHQVLREASINLPTEKLDNLCNTGFIVWSEFWQVLLDLDKSAGGLKDSSGLMGKKVFDLYHFNGIAKSVLTTGQVTSEGDTLVQRPRLTRLKVSVPPRWTPEEFMADVQITSGPIENDLVEVEKPEPPQHAPLVDCIRTRWPRAVCNWVGDSPSIV